jgi:hypothetical protein
MAVEAQSDVREWEQWPVLQRPARYSVAVIVFCLCAGLRFGLTQILGSTLPYTIFSLGILISGWYGGFGPGLLTTGLAGQ